MKAAYPKIRLHVHSSLAAQERVALGEDAAHYLRNVMRMNEGEAVVLFNGRDGDWYATLENISKKHAWALCTHQLRTQLAQPDLWLCFAPIKQGRIDYLVEKATEMGVSELHPVRTQHTIATRINEDRLRAHTIEAAEQTERQSIPTLHPLKDLHTLLGSWDKQRTLFYGDETGHGSDAFSVLHALTPKPSKCALLIGPEGGFSREELTLLRSTEFAHPFSMGPRVLRADTAAIAGLTCLQMMLGDWHHRPRFHTPDQESLPA